MKRALRFFAAVFSFTMLNLVVNAQYICQLIPLDKFATHSDGSIGPGDDPSSTLGSQGLFDTGFNQPCVAYDPILTNLSHSGSTDVRAGIYGLMAFTIGGPKLTIATSGPSLVESWTTNVGPLTLQATPSLASPSVWTNVGTGSVSGSRYVVTNPPAGGSLFYRLQK